MNTNNFDSPSYWRQLAKNERAFAAEDSSRRYGTVESIRIHLENAKMYDDRADLLEKQLNEKK